MSSFYTFPRFLFRGSVVGVSLGLTMYILQVIQ